MVPCINQNSLKLLTGTADERYLQSPDYFRRTHYPQTLYRFRGNETVDTWSEDEFRDELEGADTRGNQIYIIFGSTGSGKSELLCWVADQVSHRPDRPVIRISRTEINPQVLVAKCFESLGLNNLLAIDISKWQLLLDKPITIVNQMVWGTLSEFFDSDETIVPLALLLRPVVEENLLKFSKEVQAGHITRALELLSPDQFAELIGTTSLPMPLDYLAFRQSLREKLDQFLLNGRSIRSLFQELSRHIIAKGIRPLLLVDDLVQSVNIYAGELLDHFLSLENGTWDVVIGVTPGVLNESNKGRSIADRIETLDTIDDRVKKLWLSDESGSQFYGLTEHHVVPYMQQYLVELKRQSGFTCAPECVHFAQCQQLLFASDAVELLPFNEQLLRRMYAAIPDGKGKLRYMLLNTKKILKFVLNPSRQNAQRVVGLVLRERYADHDDPLTKQLVEWYADSTSNIATIPELFRQHFHLGASSVPIMTLNTVHPSLPPDLGQTNPSRHDDSKRLAVRDWAEGKKVNGELLNGVILGVSTLVSDAIKATLIARRFTSRKSSMLQRSETIKGSRYPIYLGNSNILTEKIVVSKGGPAVVIADYQQLKPSQKPLVFPSLANASETAQWIYQGESVRDFWLAQLAEHLTVDIDTFALRLKTWVNEWVEISRHQLFSLPSPFSTRLQEDVEQFFRDWFLLRDNICDADRLEEIPAESNFEQTFLSIRPSAVLDRYTFGSTPLGEFITTIQQNFLAYKDGMIEVARQEGRRQGHVLPLLTQLPDPEAAQIVADIRSTSTLEDISPKVLRHLAKTSNWLDDHSIFEQYEALCMLHNKTMNAYSHWLDLRVQIAMRLQSLGNQIILPEPPVVNIHWEYQRAMTEQSQWDSRWNMTQSVHDALVLTPQLAITQLLSKDAAARSVMKPFVKQWRTLESLIHRCLRGERLDRRNRAFVERWKTQQVPSLTSELNRATQIHERIHMLAILIAKDRHLPSHLTLAEIRTHISQDSNISRSLRNKLVQLLKNGETHLPSRGQTIVLSELQEQFPQTYSYVDIKIRVKKLGENDLDR